MDASEHFPEIYLKGQDFADREVVLTTRMIVVEGLYNPKAGEEEEKIVLYFNETNAKALAIGKPKTEKRIVLSKTLYVDLVTMFGSKQTKDWEGKRITFWRGPAISGGKLVIRAKPAPASKTPNSMETNANG